MTKKSRSRGSRSLDDLAKELHARKKPKSAVLTKLSPEVIAEIDGFCERYWANDPTIRAHSLNAWYEILSEHLGLAQSGVLVHAFCAHVKSRKPQESGDG